MAEIVVTRLTPVFAAQIDGADITRALDERTWGEIRAAFEEHSVLVFRGQALDDESQIAFSRRFGNLEVTRSMNPAAGTPFARQSNLDIKTGQLIPQGDRRMVYQLANMLWHSDSSFKTVPALCSLLSARIIPPEGGATEFGGMRAGYAGCRRRRSGGSRPSWWFTTSRGRGIRSSPDSSPSASARSILRFAIRSCARTPSTGGERSSWALTPRISRAWRSRRGARC